MLYIQFTNPTAYPPLEHSALLLQNEGWNVTFLGVRWPGSGNFSFTPDLQAKLHLLAAPPAGWRQKLLFLRYIVWVMLHAGLRRATWIYVSDPMAAPAGLLLSWLGFRVVYHEHDSPDGKPRTPFDALIRWSRRQLALRSTFNVLPQEERCQIFRESTGTNRPILRVWNCPRRDEISASPRPARHADEPLGIYYHGSINLTRLPLELIEAAGRSGLPIVIRAVGYESVGSVGASKALKKAAEQFWPLLKLELLGAQSRHQLEANMINMHLGWVAYSEECADVNLRHLAGASNKAFDYLAQGLMLVCNSSPEWLCLFSEYSLHVKPGDPLRSIIMLLDWAYKNPQGVFQAGEKARQVILRSWNYQREFAPALRMLSEYP